MKKHTCEGKRKKSVITFYVSILFACYDINEQTKQFVNAACKYTSQM